MTRKIHLPGMLLAIALTSSAGVASAQGAPAVKPQTAPSGVTYLTGGIGDAQQQAMKDAMPDYSLRLTFARPGSGDYLADVKVMIEQQGKGKGDMRQALDAMSTGPMLFAKVGDGEYRVRADYKGQVQTKTASIKNGGPRELVFYFPEK